MRHTKKKILPFVFASGLLASSFTHAAQLGKLDVLSGAGEPFVAEIQVDLVLPEERSTLQARLASAEAFKAARLTMDPNLKNLQFEVQDGGQPGTALVKITTTQPLPAGFIDTLVELSWAGGRVAREYTLTIPVGAATTAQPATRLPEIRPPMTPPATAPATSQVPQQAPAATPPRTEEVADSPSVVPGGTLSVQRGDTLSELALELVGDGVTLNQAMAALYEANQSSFIDGSVHLIREGAQIQVPNRAALRAKSANEALLVLANNDDRNVYSAYARQIGLLTVENQSTADSSTSSQGEITPQQQADAVPESQEDRLQIAPGAAQGSGSADASAEELLAKNKALAEANERIALLEKNVNDLQRLLDMQGDMAETPGDGEAGTPVEGDASIDGGVPSDTVQPPLEEESLESPAAEQPATEEPATEEPTAAPVPVSSEDEPFDWLPWILAGAGGLAVLVILLLVMRARRNRKDEEGNSFDSDDDSSFSDVNEFDEAIAAASAGVAAEKASSLSRSENSDFDLDEVLNDRLKPTEPEQPSQSEPVQDPVETEEIPELKEASEDAQQQTESLNSEVTLDFPEEDTEPAKPNGILDDLDMIEKGSLAAQEELDQLRNQSLPGAAVGDDDLSAAFDDLVETDENEKSSDDEVTSDADENKDKADQQEALDQAMVDLDVDVPNPNVDDATWQEVATKLDLAGAYVEIGDADGAKELLNEILKKGDVDQVRKAKALLATLN